MNAQDIRTPGVIADEGTAYAPPPKRERTGIALALSGGGYRATLFHLGAVRRLNELGVLPQITTFCSVSGGSILNAQLATKLPWPLTAPISDVLWAKLMTKPIRSFTAKDIRTDSILKRLLPWNWFRDSTGVENLAKHYERWFSAKLAALPTKPRFIFCSTDLSFGVSWRFEREMMGDYQVGYGTAPPDWPLGRTVAASSCFPPIFNPLPIRLPASSFKRGSAPTDQKNKALTDLRVNDGGTYDTLGLEPVWKDHATILCSDGAGPIVVTPDTGLLGRIGRYLAIQFNQTVVLRSRWLIQSFRHEEYDGAYWAVKSAPARYGDHPGFSKALARDVISQIRTDLDGFTDAEQSVLENHGYLLADAAIKRHAPQLITEPAPLKIPYPAWMDENAVAKALRNSGKWKFLGIPLYGNALKVTDSRARSDLSQRMRPF
jgi:NTE family protein